MFNLSNQRNANLKEAGCDIVFLTSPILLVGKHACNANTSTWNGGAGSPIVTVGIVT